MAIARWYLSVGLVTFLYHSHLQRRMKRWVLIMLLTLAACAQPSPEEPKPDRGFYLSPASTGEEDFSTFMDLTTQAKYVGWSGDWMELQDESKAPHVLAKLSEQYGYEPIIVVQFFTQANGVLLRELDKQTKETYKKLIVDFAETYKPKYVGLGIEVNELQDPTHVDEFALLFAQCYEQIKEVSPKTQVFTSFQYERMRGGGGLFGKKNRPQWDLLERFRHADIIGFTTYPNLVFADPKDIPIGYYESLLNKTDKPIAFPEVAWHAGSVPGWESSPQEQEAFVKIFNQISAQTRPAFSLWTHVFDQDVDPPFDSLGLRTKQEARPAWDDWTQP